MHTTIISAETLQRQLQGEPNHTSPWVILDVTFDLFKPEEARQAFASKHITGAIHADLDHHLSANGDAPCASGGRHPLPTREAFAMVLAAWGITPQTQVVVYDRNGHTFCGRAWWMLKWCGHDSVAVLDGGLAAWEAIGGATTDEHTTPNAAPPYPLNTPRMVLRDKQTVQDNLGGTQTVVDARAGARYRGEVEPLDPVAGHIPGALNLPFNENFDADGRFKSPSALRALWEKVLGDRQPESVVMQCGSGVSAVPNILAMQLAGWAAPALYAGSWSEWSRDPETPKQTLEKTPPADA